MAPTIHTARLPLCWGSPSTLKAFVCSTAEEEPMIFRVSIKDSQAFLCGFSLLLRFIEVGEMLLLGYFFLFPIYCLQKLLSGSLERGV